MVLIIASTAGVEDAQKKYLAAPEADIEKLIASGDLPLVHIIKHGSGQLQKQAYPVVFRREDGKEIPYTVFAVRAVSFDGKKRLFTFSRPGITTSILDDRNNMKVQDLRQFLFPWQNPTEEKTARGDLEVQQEGSDLEIYVATYHDLGGDPKWNREGEQYVSGSLFRTSIKSRNDQLARVENVATHGMIRGTRNSGGDDKRLFIGDIRDRKRTFTEAVGKTKIAEGDIKRTMVGYDRYLAVNYRGSYFGYTDNRAYFYFHVRNEQGRYDSDSEAYPYLGKTPSFASLDATVCSTALPLPATSLVFIEKYKGKDYVVFGLQNSAGRVLVFEINPQVKERKTIKEILAKNKDERELTAYLTRVGDVKVLDRKVPLEDTSVRDINEVQIRGEPHLYFSVGKSIYTVHFEKLLNNRNNRKPITLVETLAHDILSMDVLET